jgi:ectoine hydroxylase-related dioxygenase (phytanoyl-CoA dioxygenase family)
LTAADALRADGWVVLDGIFTATECDGILAASARRTWPAVTAELMTFATDARWADLVVGVLGPDVRFLREQLVSKQPRSGGTVPWHQDIGYLPMRPSHYLTCIVALEAMTEDNGCLCVLPGSHRRGPVDHMTAGQILRVDADVDDPGVAVTLAQGSVLAFSSLTFHRSGPNRTEGSRPAWLVQFCVADAVDERRGVPFVEGPVVAAGGTWTASRA